MTPAAVVRALRAHPTILVVGFLVGLLVGILVSASRPPSFTSSASVYLSDAARPAASGDAVNNSVVFAQRIASYTELAVSDRVLGAVNPRLEPVIDRSEVSAASPPNSGIVTISTTGHDNARTVAVANAVAESFARAVPQLDAPPPGNGRSVMAATVIDTAAPAPSAAAFAPTRLAVSAIAGLLVAISFVVARAALDGRVDSRERLAALTGVAVLGAVPDRSRRRAVRRGDAGDVTAAIQRLRTVLRFVEGRPRVLIFTGASAGTGTSGLVYALAEVHARSSRTLLIDADLRRPSVGERLGVRAAMGLSNVLNGEVCVEKAIERVGELDVLAAGPTPPDPDDLLSSDVLRDILHELRGRYDNILIDGAPAGSVMDAAVVAAHVDGSVLVCRERYTRARSVDEALEALRVTGATMIGSVLTSATDTDAPYATDGGAHRGNGTVYGTPARSGSKGDPTSFATSRTGAVDG